jgi:peptide/nickel transport system substrate-binding protein
VDSWPIAAYGRLMVKRAAALLCVALLAAACTGGANTGSTLISREGAGGTLSVGLSGPVFLNLDPQGEWSFAVWEILRCCLLRTLMSYDGSPGVAGTHPRPDLAASFPDISTDGLAWTFHLRPGLHYGPPLQGVQITSRDIARAILRSADQDTDAFGLGRAHLSNIEGFNEYREGKADSISGLVTPDPLTLSIHLIRSDASIPYDMALPTTAPIPPSPSDPSARYGVATGHDRSPDPSKVEGYGLFAVSSGPYMIEGEDAVDFSQPPADQPRPSGFQPWTYHADFSPIGYGSLNLVRNPSWDPATDPLRRALPERIVIRGGSSDTLFREFRNGRLDLVFDEAPPPKMLDRYLNIPDLRPYVQSIDTGNIVIAEFNLTQPPFDDLAVRRAVALGLDRRAMLDPIRRGMGSQGWSAVVVANHYAPDGSEDGLPSGWSPFPHADGSPDLQAARRALSTASYDVRGGRCVDTACRRVRVFVSYHIPQVAEVVRRNLARVGIVATVTVRDDYFDACQKAAHVGLCVGSGWLPDYPMPRDLLISMFAGTSVVGGIGTGNTRLGASPAVLAARGAIVRSVPSVDPEIRACDETVGAATVACWTRLDQYVITQLMPTVPLAFGEAVRITSPSIVSFSWDQGAQQPALDRIAVANDGATASASAPSTG